MPDPNNINKSSAGTVAKPKEAIKTVAFVMLLLTSAPAIAAYTIPQGKRPLAMPTQKEPLCF